MEETGHLYIEFFTRAVENKRESDKAGRAIFDDGEFVRIRWVGDRNRILEAPAHSRCGREGPGNREITYAQKFPRHYDAFKQGVEIKGSGTPLDKAPFMPQSKAEELKHFNVHTVEQLAALDGTPLQNLGMGAREWKNKAQAFLDLADGTADVTRLAAENDAMKAQIAAMQEQLTSLRGVGVPAPVEPATEDAGSPVSDGGGEPDAADKIIDNLSRSANKSSLFDEWENGDIRAFLKERGVNAAGRTSREKLIAMADEQRKKEAA